MLKLIVATDRNYGFAKNGTIPWNSHTDLNHFAELTTTTVDHTKQNIVIMGRKTWDTLPIKHKPLKNRLNIIVSTTIKIESETCRTFETIESAVKFSIHMHLTKKIENVFIIGGLSLYTYGLNSVLLDKVYLTRIDAEYNCDQYFPKKLLFDSSSREMAHDKTVIENNIRLEFMVFDAKRKFKGEQQYQNLLWSILNIGHHRETRNSFTYSTFGHTMKFDLKDGFPLLTTKKMFLRGIFYELKMLLMGKTNTKKYLSDYGVRIWEPNTTKEFQNKIGLGHLEEFDLGPAYGFQLLHFAGEYSGMDKDYTGVGFNQLDYILETIIKDKHSRRLIMTVFNPAKAACGVLYPCTGIIYQFYITGDNKLEMYTYIRSSDQISGFPWNVGFFALLIHVIVELINNSDKYTGDKLSPGKLIIGIGDIHLYDKPDHIDAALEHLVRTPYEFPSVTISGNKKNIEDFEWSDIKITGYKSHPAIKAEMIA